MIPDRDKTILSLSGDKALEYFLESRNFCTIFLPKYFDFSGVLHYVKNVVGNFKYTDIKKTDASKNTDVNYKILVNKVNKLSYRLLQISNPYLYYLLARYICESDNWKDLVQRFDKLESDEHIRVCSIPKIKNEDDKCENATNIRVWLTEFEEKSLEMGLEYKYVYCTDISNCYPSLYTHSIVWAIHDKIIAKENKNDKKLIGNQIDYFIRCMQNGQTNGIPQGSVLFDFIAEIILCYADNLLVTKLRENGIMNYIVFRYRDDYRIFSNNKDELEDIAKELQLVLYELNLQLNHTKTKLSDNIIEASIKDDKMYYYFQNIKAWGNIQNNESNETDFENKQKILFHKIERELLCIYSFSKKYPNSGTLFKLLSLCRKNIKKIDKFDYINITVLSSIIIDILIDNPRVFSVGLSIISHFTSKMNETDSQFLVNKIYEKIKTVTNNAFMEIWMQRLTIPIHNSKISYSDKICKIISKDETCCLWNVDWIKSKFVNIAKLNDFIKMDQPLDPEIQEDEISCFSDSL